MIITKITKKEAEVIAWALWMQGYRVNKKLSDTLVYNEQRFGKNVFQNTLQGVPNKIIKYMNIYTDQKESFNE